ncbi:MAG: AzlC family ABC transporter permease [Oscillospiraceae bacterium]|nr:AzlC family ABC transporter permease [Oscillospiraceae bacterium]
MAVKDKKEKQNTVLKALKIAFPYTIPVFTGFTFLGISYGVLMTVSGFPAWCPILISIVVYGGSLQFAAVAMLLSTFAPVEVFAVALMVQARHLFYGITMIERYKNMGWKKFFLIFGMSDETFSINCSTDAPKGVDKGWFMMWVTLLDWGYWVGGTAVGAVLGNFITFNTEGLDFAMTAMFVVIFIEQWLKDKKHWSAIIGAVASVGCLVIFGADSFLIPTMLCILVLLGIFRKPIEKAGDGQ